MRLSVIIPVYNEAEGITACLSQFRHVSGAPMSPNISPLYGTSGNRCVLDKASGQTSKQTDVAPEQAGIAGEDRLEIIVCDAGSTDNTPEKVRVHAGVRYIVAPKGRGPQMNAGAEASTGDILLFLHADTFLPPGAIGAISQACALPGVVAGFFKNKMAHDSGQGYLFHVVAPLLTLRSRVSKRPFGDMAIFVQRDVFFAMGGYRDIPVMEDYEFSKRLCRQGRVIRLPLCVTTSARRFRRGIFRMLFLMSWMRFCFNMGVSPQRLALWYK